ncbi:hypothetical protein EWB00_007868 [Schistosoma japonicum]|uniref:C2 domain-containing protein n=1 Tax=Schistosoma japonicum TaxID=6182 RepID=A0A4Z2CSY0_SCHJA|nr:hypothetical protein EWB00_007868 [Schistosoma japonicum]
MKDLMKPYDRRQQRYSLQQMSSYQLNENDKQYIGQRNHRIKLIFGLNTPPMNITKPQMVQPDNRIFTKKIYTCTVGALNVTINRLTGVSNLIKNTNSLPSQTPTNYVVGLRLRHNRTSLIYRNENDNEVDRMSSLNNNNNGFYRKYFTQPILTSLNPNFDESFVFPLKLNELKNAELVLTVLQSTTMYNSIGDDYNNVDGKSLPRRNHSVTSYSYPYTSGIDRIPRRMNMISEEMRCIGVTFYKLNQHELINCPEKMQNIWQELRKLPEVQSRQVKTTSYTNYDTNNSTFPINSSTNYELYPFNLVNENNKFDELQYEKTMLNSDNDQNEDWKQSMIKVTILYKMRPSILEIFIEELKNFKIFKDETEIIIQALFCLGNTTLSIVKSKPYQIIKTKSNETINDSNKTFNIYNHITLSNNEHISLNVDINRLLNFSNIGIILQLFIRTNTSNQLRRLANLSIGMTKLTYDLAIQQWNDLINELKQLKNDKLYDGSTKKITYWHLIESY